MLKLKDKSASTEKVPAATALTPTEWREHLDKQAGEYVVVGGRPGDELQTSAPWDRATAQRIFDEVVEACDFTAKPGYSVKIVAAVGYGGQS